MVSYDLGRVVAAEHLLDIYFTCRVLCTSKLPSGAPGDSCFFLRSGDFCGDACVDAGIEEIVVVRGYMGECFNQLTDKYPNIKFVDNPNYEKYNNISSAYLVKDLIGGSYIFESDIYLVNTDLITKYQYESNYLGVPCDETPDWCFDTDENLKITDLHKPGKNCHHMYGISYYDKETGDWA